MSVFDHQRKETRQMRKRKTAVPTEMEEARKRLEEWRSKQVHRGRIPEIEWAAAVELARRHGVNRTSRILRLDYGKLKKLLETGGGAVRHKHTAMKFMELIGPQTGTLAECRFEVESPRGKLKIELKGTTIADVAALSRALWSEQQ